MNIKRFVLGPVMTNMYVVNVGKEGFLVDCAYQSEDVDRYIKDYDIDIKFILQTHTHFDHVGGLSYYKKLYDVDVYASEDARDIAEDTNYNLSSKSDNMRVPIDIYLKDDEVFSSFNIRAIKTPGHTKDSMSYLFEDALFSGDTLFNLSIGRTDFPGGNYNEIMDSIFNKLGNLNPNTILLPGHGEESTIGYELKNNPFLK